MPGFDLPYEPIRRSLYSKEDLFAEFDPADPVSFSRMTDFAIYRHFVKEGRSAPSNPYSGMMQGLHDTSITQATAALIASKKVAATMGGHKLPRNSPTYRDVALLSKRLTQSGILMCSGGGPGAMEATHLGASLFNEPDKTLDDAIGELGKIPEIPPLTNIVAADGAVDVALVHAAHRWLKPAIRLARSIQAPGNSLAIPTWHYGHEPSTPLATHISKYFQNSIREDGLLALASQGVIYAEGKAGTIQEIFQDAAQNYYRTFGHFSPMVLFGEKYWKEKFPVTPVLKTLFGEADYAKYVLVTDDVNEAAHFIEDFSP